MRPPGSLLALSAGAGLWLSAQTQLGGVRVKTDYRTAHDGDHLAERPFLDEFLASFHPQGNSDDRFRSMDGSSDLRLDFTCLLGDVAEHDVLDLQSLRFDLHRHTGKRPQARRFGL